MALKLNNSIKSNKRVILSIDPSITDKSDYSKYLSENYNEDNLVFAQGEEPTRFVIRSLSNKMKCWIDGHEQGLEQHIARIRCSLQSIENSDIPQPKIKFNQKLSDDIITEEWINEHFSVPTVIIIELSQHISMISEVTPFLSATVRQSKQESGDGQ